MPGEIATLPRLQFNGTTGAPLVSGTLTSYLSGSTTKTPTWQDQALSIENTNPIVLDSRGSCLVWLDNSKTYKIVLADKNGVVIWTQDNVVGGGVDASVVLNAGLIQSAVNEAAASAAEALGYLQAYRATSYGALAADPTLDPLGNAPTVGDEYFNTSANLLKRWNGATWQASDISTANLAAAGGAGLVGYQPPGTGAPARDMQAKSRDFISLVDCAADPTGVADCWDALNRGISYLASIGGGTLYGDAAHTYRLGSDYSITTSNITIDLRGGRLTGAGWLKFNGDNGVNNDWACIENVHFRNARIGSGMGSTTRAPFFLYCANSTMENIQRHSYGDTGFNMFMCKRTHFRNIVSRGGKNTGTGAFGGLMLHCIDSTFEDAVALEGPFHLLWQIKGGQNCRGIRCNGRDVVSGGTVTVTYGNYIRGDDPWGVSPTTGYSYPYPTGSWGAPDSQRATRISYFDDCLVENTACSLAVYHAQEFIDAGFRECRDIENTGAGFVGVKLAGGSECDFELSDCTGYRSSLTLPSAGVTASSSDSTNLQGVKIRRNKLSGYGYSGVYVKSADAEVADNTVADCCGNGSASHQSAFNALTGSNISYTGNKATDTRATKSHAYGFASDATCANVVASGNEANGYLVRPYAIVGPAKLSSNLPGDLICQTTDGVGVTGLVLAPFSGKSLWVEVLLTGRDTTGVVGIWKIGGNFKNAAGTVSQDGATVALMTAINPGVWGGASFQVISNTVRIIVSGKAATAIAWVGQVGMTGI